MARFVELRRAGDSAPLYFNPDHVAHFGPVSADPKDGTDAQLSNGMTCVVEERLGTVHGLLANA